MSEPLISVIVPTKNSSNTLAQCLNSLISQTYRNIEILVVDNYSTDSTIQIAKNYTNKIFVIGSERSAQTNYGVMMSSGKYVYRIDSDFVLEPNTIKEAVETAESNNYAAVLIHNSSDDSISFWAKVRKFERDMLRDDALNVAARFIRKDLFILMGGLDVHLVAGEDYDIHNRLIKRYKIGRINSREVHIGEYKSLKDIAKKNYYYGRTIYFFLKKNKYRGIKQTIPFRMIYLRHWREFFVNPRLMGGFLVYEVVKYSAALCGLISFALRI